MSDFMELKLPQCEDAGEGRWYIWTMEPANNGMWYSLIADGSGDLKPPRPQEEFKNDHMFNTEEAAHVAANDYYFLHGRTYPYISKWAASVDTTKVSDSQVMDFEE